MVYSPSVYTETERKNAMHLEGRFQEGAYKSNFVYAPVSTDLTVCILQHPLLFLNCSKAKRKFVGIKTDKRICMFYAALTKTQALIEYDFRV